MNNESVTVIYKWIAKPGKLEELTGIYQNVAQAMEQNEPGARAVHCYVAEEDNTLHVRDEFANAEAVGFHLGTTAANHFASLLEIATPGPFLFFGTVPDEIKQGTQQMGLPAEFAPHAFGYDR